MSNARNQLWRTMSKSVVVVGVVVLIISAALVVRRHEPVCLVSGHTVAYWLEQLPPGGFDAALLPADNPLVRGGPEIIPSLLAAIHRNYAVRDFFNRWRGVVRLPFQKYYAVQPPPGWAIREVAAFRLGLMGSVASNAVPTLVDLLKKPSANPFERGRVIQALGEIGPSASEAVPVLVESLKNSNQWVRWTAAYSLLQIGTVPPEAVPLLQQNLGDPGYVVALMAVAILSAQETPEAVSRVETLLTTRGDGNTQSHVAAALGLLKKVPDQFRPILGRMLNDEDASVRQGAAIGLAQPHADDIHRIVEVLIEGLKQGQFMIRCAEALGRIGPQAGSAIPELKQAQGYVLWLAAQNTLGNIEQVEPPNERQQHEFEIRPP
jgi:HEAT repeat protein